MHIFYLMFCNGVRRFLPASCIWPWDDKHLLFILSAFIHTLLSIFTELKSISFTLNGSVLYHSPPPLWILPRESSNFMFWIMWCFLIWVSPSPWLTTCVIQKYYYICGRGLEGLQLGFKWPSCIMMTHLDSSLDAFCPPFIIYLLLLYLDL